MAGFQTDVFCHESWISRMWILIRINRRGQSDASIRYFHRQSGRSQQLRRKASVFFGLRLKGKEHRRECQEQRYCPRPTSSAPPPPPPTTADTMRNFFNWKASLCDTTSTMIPTLFVTISIVRCQKGKRETDTGNGGTEKMMYY